MADLFHRKKEETDEADELRLRRHGVEAYRKTAPVKVILLIAIVVVAVVAIMAFKDHNRRIENIGQLEAAGEAMQKKPAVWKDTGKTRDKEETETDPFDDYESPIDFGTLRQENEDVIGWLSIPGTDIEYPILQSKDDNTFYLNHNINGDEDRNGSLFTEVTYNRDDFSDPVTAIYGHNMASGKMFGNLQETFSQGFEGHDKAIVYLPDSQKEYKIIAALPVGAGHLLYGRDMNDSSTYMAFADDLVNGGHSQALIDDTAEIAEGQRILVLSTCTGQPDMRYIVAGIEQDYDPEDDDELRARKAEDKKTTKKAKKNKDKNTDEDIEKNTDKNTDKSSKKTADNTSEDDKKVADAAGSDETLPYDTAGKKSSEDASDDAYDDVDNPALRDNPDVTYKQGEPRTGTATRKSAKNTSGSNSGSSNESSTVSRSKGKSGSRSGRTQVIGAGSYISPKTGNFR